MARPVKNYCDYFSHDRDMRNHRKIKALRNTYGISGYAIWCMLLEYLTGSDGNVFEYSDVELELMCGDFGVSVTEIRSVVDYCIRLELLFLKDGFINSESLDERLSSVYEKRHLAKSKSSKQLRSNGKFISNNTESVGVSVTEMPQSKVNKSKVNKILPIGSNEGDDKSENQKLENSKKNNMASIKDTEGIPLPFKSPNFASIWSEWLQHRKEARIKNYTPTGLKRLFTWLVKASGNDESVAINIIDQSLSKGWQGLFELKPNYNATNLTNSSPGSQSGSSSRARIQAAKDF